MPMEKMIKISAEVHKTLKDLSTNKDETFSDIIASLQIIIRKDIVRNDRSQMENMR